MEVPTGLVFLFIALIFQLSDSATIVVDGVSKWRNPSVHVGDSIIFSHKYNHNLYVFPNERAFNLCNFARAVLLTKPDSTSFTVKWDPSRSGFFYFTFSNGSLRGCREGEKLAIEVSLSPSENMAASPELSSVAAPSPTSGGIVSSSPAYAWPFKPRVSTSPSTAPSAIPPATSPALLPEKGDGIPFINSNPAVPLPTGEVDSATIRPLPTSGHGGQVLGLFAVQMALSFVVSLLLL